MHTFAGHNQIIRHSYANKTISNLSQWGYLCALSLAGCMEKDLYQAPEEKTADEYFGFTTSSSCTVDLNYGLNYQVVFELYAENPLSEDKDGNIIKTKEEPVYRGATDKKRNL